MYVCIYVYMCIRMCVYIYMYVHMYIYQYICADLRWESYLYDLKKSAGVHTIPIKREFCNFNSTNLHSFIHNLQT